MKEGSRYSVKRVKNDFDLRQPNGYYISKLILKKVATEIEHILRLSKLTEYASH